MAKAISATRQRTRVVARASKLPKAPLAEVFFELRWKVVEQPNPFWPVGTDPGFPVLTDRFALFAKRAGFSFIQHPRTLEIQVPNQTAIRFSRSGEEVFPMWQIGHGIFAANDGPSYDFRSFKKFVRAGLLALSRSYPQLGMHEIVPTRLQLKYIDFLHHDLIDGPQGTLGFLSAATNLAVNEPEFFRSSKFDDLRGTRLSFGYPVRGQRGTQFSFDAFSAEREGKGGVKAETTVTTTSPKLPRLSKGIAFSQRIEQWLVHAHSLTSPFFRWWVKPEVLEKFK